MKKFLIKLHCVFQVVVLQIVFGKKNTAEILSAWKFLNKRKVAGYSVRTCWTCLEGEIEKVVKRRDFKQRKRGLK